MNMFADLVPAASQGGGAIIPYAQRSANRPTMAAYGSNFPEARSMWMHGSDPSTLATSAPSTPATHTASGAHATNALSPTQALGNFANSAGMQFQLQQGSDAIQNRYAAHGALQSGAAMKALSDYAQGTALNNYFMPYMSLLGGQQAVGAQAGSAVAGVGSSFGNAATGINSNLGNATTNINGQMGGAIQNGANAAAQGAYVNGAANVGLGNTIGSALGQFGSSFFQPNTNSGLGQSRYPIVNGVDPLAPLP